MTRLKIEIVSDVACPWCPIGYRLLQQAMETLAAEDFTFDVVWRPFELAPDMPVGGTEIVPHLAQKYGRGESEIIASQRQIMAVAEALGLDFTGALKRRAVNTFDAHRVLMWAGEQGRQTECALALFDAYFGRAENPADPAVLRRAAAQSGLEADGVDEILSSDRYADAVRREEQDILRARIQAVPTFMVDGKPLLQGAQEPEAFVRALRKAA